MLIHNILLSKLKGDIMVFKIKIQNLIIITLFVVTIFISSIVYYNQNLTNTVSATDKKFIK